MTHDVSKWFYAFLDVYVFGIGDNVKKNQLNALASKKRGETHIFILKNFKTLGKVFNSIISKFETQKYTLVFENFFFVNIFEI